VGWVSYIYLLFNEVLWNHVVHSWNHKPCWKVLSANNSFSLLKPKNFTTLHCSHCLGQNVLASLTPREQLKAAENTYLIGSCFYQPRSKAPGRVNHALKVDVPQL
jgi:hypothetical protein